MTLHVHRLAGCRPAPLAHYLKALGILRIVAEQADPEARGWWADEKFMLLSTLDRDALEQFFVEEYSPTPFVSPWNKGSGFYSANDPALTPIEDSVAKRFAAFREGIAVARDGLAEMMAADAAIRGLKDRTKAKKGMSVEEKRSARALKDDPEFKKELDAAEKRFKSLKAGLFVPCARSWRGRHRAWMDSALVLGDDGKPHFPSLLGTGGNDGRLDFTNNAMQRIADLFDLSDPVGKAHTKAPDLLLDALYGRALPALSSKAAIGQFLPGDAGGANSTTAADGDSLINPWDFLLMMEGTIVLQSRATRRLAGDARAGAGAPFALHAHAAGFASPGSEKSTRGEQWMPLWEEPSSVEEISALFGEARLQIGRQVANRPVDAARALARLGSTRGIQRFTRFGFLERNGQSNLAVPLGRISVRQDPLSRLIDDLAGWLDRLQRVARSDHAPHRLVHAERKLADAVFAALSHDPSPSRWQAVLIAAAEVEVLQSKGTGILAGPIPELRPEWVSACDDGSVEWRLAVCLGSAVARYATGERIEHPVRDHWLPLDRRGRFDTDENGKKLTDRTEVVMSGRDVIDDAIAVVTRRMIDATSGTRRLPLVAAYRCAAAPRDLAAFMSGDCDDVRLHSLARACMAVRWSRWDERYACRAPLRSDSDTEPDAGWWAVRLSCLPWRLDDALDIPADPSVVRRCASGDGAAAVSAAVARLRSHGLHPAFAGGIVDAVTSRRWAAALVFPISKAAAKRAARTLDPSLNNQEGT